MKLVVTNIVVREIEANIDRSVRHAFNAQKQFIKEVRLLAGSSAVGIADKIQAFDREEVIKDLVKQFNDFLAELDAIIIETDDVSIDAVIGYDVQAASLERLRRRDPGHAGGGTSICSSW